MNGNFIYLIFFLKMNLIITLQDLIEIQKEIDFIYKPDYNWWSDFCKEGYEHGTQGEMQIDIGNFRDALLQNDHLFVLPYNYTFRKQECFYEEILEKLILQVWKNKRFNQEHQIMIGWVDTTKE